HPGTVAHMRLRYLQAQRRSGFRGSPQLARHSRIVWIEHDGDFVHRRRHLLEQLEPFSRHRELEIGEPGGVAARPCQTFDQPAGDRVGDGREHDWDRAGLLLLNPGYRSAMRDDRSRFRLASSAAWALSRPASPSAMRISIRKLWPSVQPNE